MKNPQTILAHLENVSKTFENTDKGLALLKDVNLVVPRGKIVLIMGPSGSGKTTLLTLLAGLQQPNSGKVYLFGKKVEEYSKTDLQKLRANKIGFVFQSFYLINSLTALENVMLAAKFAGLPKKTEINRAKSFLNRFDVGYLANHYPRTFSQGEKQRVALARALVNSPSLIIADEPTGSLASDQAFAVIEYLKAEVQRQNLSVLLTSHDQRIERWADEVHYLSNGSLASI